MSVSKLAAASIAVLALVEAKKRPHVLIGSDEEVAEPQMEKTHEKKVRKPLVEAGADSLCLFQDANNSWCFAGTSPMLETGWEFYQKYDQGYWNVQFKPYVKSQMSVTSNFILTRMISSTF